MSAVAGISIADYGEENRKDQVDWGCWDPVVKAIADKHRSDLSLAMPPRNQFLLIDNAQQPILAKILQLETEFICFQLAVG